MNAALIGITLLLDPGPKDPTAFINQHFAQYWQEEKITPSARCSDHEFLRRASLDLIGRIPTLSEIDAFHKDPPAERRQLLIDRLLQHEDGPRHWANLWTEWLLGPSPPTPDRQAFHGWLQQHFARDGSHKELAEKLVTAKGATRDNPAVHFFVTQRGLKIPEKDWQKHGQYDMAPAALQIVRAFHGRRQFHCVQCHDNPLDDDLNQAHFYGISAFLRQVEFKSKQVGKDIVDEIDDNPEFNVARMVGYQRRNTIYVFTDPTFLDGKKIPRAYKGSRRESLAELLVRHPDFARAYVNRMWTYLLGQGLGYTSAGDDVGTQPIAHPKVLDRLVQEFIACGHAPKAVIRAICLSDSYGLSSVANKTHVLPKSAVAFARQHVRPLSNEQIVESVMTAVQPRQERSQRASQQLTWLKELYTPRLGVSECEMESTDPVGDNPLHRVQWLMNGKSFHAALNDTDGTLAAIIKEHKELSAPALSLLHLHALSRPASDAEIERLMDAKRFQPQAQLINPNPQQFWRFLGVTQQRRVCLESLKSLRGAPICFPIFLVSRC